MRASWKSIVITAILAALASGAATWARDKTRKLALVIGVANGGLILLMAPRPEPSEMRTPTVLSFAVQVVRVVVFLIGFIAVLQRLGVGRT